VKIIYETKGRAREYCELAASMYLGCAHGCFYCFAPQVLRKTRNDFIHARERKGVIDALVKEAPLYEGKEVLMSFTTDPYQPIDEDLRLTRHALEIFVQNNIRPVILTKGGMRSVRDFDILSYCGGKYGTTLTYLDPAFSQLEEPAAAPPQERLDALMQAHEGGIETWVSLEPVIDPEETIEIIRRTYDFVDEYRIGVLNYDRRAKSIDYRKFAETAVEMLALYGKRYYIKTDLREYLRQEPAASL